MHTSLTVAPPSPTPTAAPPLAHVPFLSFHTTSANMESFAVAFWSGVLYTLAVGILTGVIAGFIIYRIQKRNDSRRFAHECGADVIGFASLIYGTTMWDVSIDSNDNYNPFGSSSLVTTIQEHSRIPVWQSILPQNKPLYQFVRTYQDAFYKFAVSYRLLDADVRLAVAKYVASHASPGNQIIYDSAFADLARRYSLGCCLMDANLKVYERALPPSQLKSLRDVAQAVIAFVTSDKEKGVNLELCAQQYIDREQAAFLLRLAATAVYVGAKSPEEMREMTQRLQEPLTVEKNAEGEIRFVEKDLFGEIVAEFADATKDLTTDTLQKQASGKRNGRRTRRK